MSSAMNVVEDVAGHASRRRVFVTLIGMALIAPRLAMCAAQWKVRAIMVEPCFMPRVVIVTTLAFRAETTFVWLIGLVAIHTP